MKKIILIMILFVSKYSIAQDTYWQQYLHYTIDAQLNDEEKTITGSEEIVYKNNSKDHPEPHFVECLKEECF